MSALFSLTLPLRYTSEVYKSCIQSTVGLPLCHTETNQIIMIISFLILLLNQMSVTALCYCSLRRTGQSGEISNKKRQAKAPPFLHRKQEEFTGIQNLKLLCCGIVFEKQRKGRQSSE